MADKIVMPKLGLTMTEGTISDWKKSEGDRIEVGEAFFDVETDKLVNTIESAVSGTVLKIIGEVGETYPCLELIAVVGEDGEDISAITGGGAPSAQDAAETASAAKETPSGKKKEGRVIASPRAKKLAEELGVNISDVAGTGPNGRISEDDVKNHKQRQKASESEAQESNRGPKISPVAAKVAEELGIDISEIAPKAGERILGIDILKYVGLRKSGGETRSEPEEKRVKLSGMRKAIAKNMLNSKNVSPTVSFYMGVDMTELKAARTKLKNAGINVTYTDMLVKFCAHVLKEFPRINASMDGDELIIKNYVNMGVAVALDDGLVVPNIKRADGKTLREISAEVSDLAERARKNELSMEEMRGGTFTITNLGRAPIESFTPIINQPELAILGVSAVQDKAVVVDGQIVIRPIMGLSLTADHRIIDGALAVDFLQRLKELLENPFGILA